MIGVYLQFNRQSEAACRALLLEVRANYEALAEMTQLPMTGWVAGKANPGWLSHSIWDTQVAYVAKLLDPRTLKLVVQAYATLDAVPDMRVEVARGSGPPYSYGGWISDHISRAHEAFRQVRDYLGDFVADQDSWRRFLPVWIVKRFNTGMMLLLALIPILGLEVAMWDYRIGNKIFHSPDVPLIRGFLWDFVAFPGMLAIPFVAYSCRVLRETKGHNKILWSLAIFLTVVIFRYGIFYIPLFYFGSVRIRK